MPVHDHTEDYALDLALPDPGLEFIPSVGRLRVVFGGQVVADSRRALLRRPRPWAYYFPQADVRMEFLAQAKARDEEGRVLYDVRVGDAVAERSAWSIPDPLHPGGATEEYFSFRWDKMDAWYEEDEELFIHPRDPYVRVEVRQSSRPIKVVIADRVVAETNRPVLLFETGLRTRFYIPKADVRMELLVPSDTHTGCPYKGIASYYSFKDGDTLIKDIVWYYPYPYPELGKIQNLLSFYDEKVQGFWVDGRLLKRA